MTLLAIVAIHTAANEPPKVRQVMNKIHRNVAQGAAPQSMPHPFGFGAGPGSQPATARPGAAFAPGAAPGGGPRTPRADVSFRPGPFGASPGSPPQNSRTGANFQPGANYQHSAHFQHGANFNSSQFGARQRYLPQNVGSSSSYDYLPLLHAFSMKNSKSR